MKKIDLAKLTNDELLIEAKKRKSAFNLFKVFIGIMIGAAVFTTYKQGFGFFTIFPVFFLPLALATKSSYNEAQKEIAARN